MLSNPVVVYVKNIHGGFVIIFLGGGLMEGWDVGHFHLISIDTFMLPNTIVNFSFRLNKKIWIKQSRIFKCKMLYKDR